MTALLISSSGLFAAASPHDVGDRAQLFVDRLLVRDTERVWFTQHQGRKHPKNPLVVSDQPWEGWRVYVYGSVLYDEQEKLFKMWYVSAYNEEYGFGYVTCYATSEDGIRWKKPHVGTLRSKNGKPHNAVHTVHIASVMKDLKDPSPARRYKMIASQSPAFGYRTFISPDGLNWRSYSKEPIAPWYDVITGFWDARRELFVAFPKNHFTPWRGHTRRLFYTITSKDFVNWTEPVLSWKTDLRDDAGSLARVERVRPLLAVPDDPKLMRTEYYGIGVWPAESCTIGFPWMLTVNNNRPDGQNQDGPQEVQLAVSRDLVNWERPFRTPVIPYGRLDEWDASYHTTASSAIRVGDEIWLYYGGANYTHASVSTGRPASIGLVTWTLDRFVSVDAPDEGGTLTTIPVEFSGDRLIINAKTKAGGRIVAELLDPSGRPLKGWTKSEPFRGDELRHVVRFGEKDDLSALAGKAVSLRFHIVSASLFSFALRQ